MVLFIAFDMSFILIFWKKMIRRIPVFNLYKAGLFAQNKFEEGWKMGNIIYPHSDKFTDDFAMNIAQFNELSMTKAKSGRSPKIRGYGIWQAAWPCDQGLSDGQPRINIYCLLRKFRSFREWPEFFLIKACNTRKCVLLRFALCVLFRQGLFLC